METDNRAVVQAAWQAFASHDAERIAAVFTEDAEWLAPAGNATAVALDRPPATARGHREVFREAG